MKKMTEERKNKMKINLGMVFVYACGLFTAHTLTKMVYQQKLNNHKYNSEKFEHFMFGEKDKDNEIIHGLKRKNNLLEMKMRQYERDNELRKEIEEIGREN